MSGSLAQIAMLVNLGVARMFDREPLDAARSLSWSFGPYYTVPLLLVAILCVIGFFRMRVRLGQRRLSWWPLFIFSLAWVSLVIAMNSPVHEIGEQLFWVHMTQHEILVLFSAPLLVLARPIGLLLWAVPRRWREGFGAAAKSRSIRKTWLLISMPAAAWLLHAIALWAWHAPTLFEATLHSDFIHGLQHASFLGTALLFWWALIDRHRGRLSRGSAVIYVFTTAVHTSVLGALLTFAPRPWYPSYAATAPAWGMSAMQDQQIGGLIMWVPSGTVLTLVGLAMVVAALRASDRRWEDSQTATLLREAPGVAHES